jgi:hypothetical protein
MSRVTRKNEENAVANALLKYLSNNGLLVSDKVMGDRPDLIFNFDGTRTGCEIASVVPNRIRSGIARGIKRLQRKGVRVVRTIIPFEPHVWVSEIIKAKAAEYDSYAKIMSLAPHECMFLLLHAPLFAPFDIVDYNRIEVWSLMVRAAARTPSKYGAIFFCDQNGKVRALKTVTPLPRPVDFFDLTNGYPTYVRYDCSNTWEDDQPDGERDYFYLNVAEENTIRIEPIAREFIGFQARIPGGNYAFNFCSHSGGVIPAETYTGVCFADLSHTLNMAVKYGVRNRKARLHSPPRVLIGAILMDKNGVSRIGDTIELPPL